MLSNYLAKSHLKYNYIISKVRLEEDNKDATGDML